MTSERRDRRASIARAPAGHGWWRGVLLARLLLALAACSTAHPSPQATATAAQAYARQVLTEASLPPGAHLSNTVDSNLLKQPFSSIGARGLIDLHQIYVVTELPNQVECFIRANLRHGSSLSESGMVGGPQGSATGLVVSLSTSGPNEYFAQLVYEIAPAGPSASEVRVDAQVVWGPHRSPQELVSANGVVDVTGFSQTSLANNSSGPVTVELNYAQANTLTTIANSLPLAPPPSCMEDSLLYRIVFRATPGSPNTFELDGYQCGSTILVTKNGQKLAPLNDASCSLLRAVVKVLATDTAHGTRNASADCTRG